MTTLPRLAVTLGVSLDWLRKFVRRDPALRGLGVKIGAARGYDVAAINRITNAVKRETVPA